VIGAGVPPKNSRTWTLPLTTAVNTDHEARTRGWKLLGAGHHLQHRLRVADWLGRGYRFITARRSAIPVVAGLMTFLAGRESARARWNGSVTSARPIGVWLRLLLCCGGEGVGHCLDGGGVADGGAGDGEYVAGG
jgi:hypothetical protein